MILVLFSFVHNILAYERLQIRRKTKLITKLFSEYGAFLNEIIHTICKNSIWIVEKSHSIHDIDGTYKKQLILKMVANN